jgi:hypothetical protein
MQPDPIKTSDARQAAVPGGEPDAPHGARKNQRQQILDKLVAAQTWVPAPELASVSLQYSARIRELRLEGYAIENRVKIAGGRKLGAFRLKSWVAVENGKLVSKPTRTTTTANQDGYRDYDEPRLFSRETMESCLAPRHRDEG